MKKITFLNFKRELVKFLLCTYFLVCFFNSNAQIAFQGFEGSASDNWGYVADPTFYDLGADYWHITTSTDNLTAYSGNFVGGEDLRNANNATGNTYLTFNAVAISGSVEISFRINYLGYDMGDFIHFEVAYDNGTDWSSPDHTEEINANGVSGASTGWEEVTHTVPAGNTHVRVRIHIFQNGSDEIGLDHFQIASAVSSPTLTTTAASSVYGSTATLGGNISSDGGASVTERGVVYSVTSNNADPQIGGGGVIQDLNGSGTGSFTESISGLSLNTGYSFRAYAINSEGTSYGSVLTFTTDAIDTNVFLGTTNSDWATASNWSLGNVPTNAQHVLIPNVTNDPVIGATTGATTNNLTVEGGGDLEVTSGGSIIVSGTSSGKITYNVNVSDTNWHLISAPVIGEQYDDAWNTANNIEVNLPNEAVSTYINTSDANGDWVYFQDGGIATTFDSGIGYSLKRTVIGSYAFIGNIEDTDKKVTVTANDIGGAGENRWNLVGNPFPAYLSIDDFLALSGNATSLTDTHENVYVWNGTSYVALSTGYIHPGQAFFVNANIASTNIYMDEVMLSHQTGITFYRNNTTDPQVELSLSDGQNTRSTEIKYTSGKTTGLDPRYDVGTFTGTATDFNVFTHLVNNSQGVDFMRQTLPNSGYENMVIPIGIHASSNAEITFTANAMNIPNGLHVYLEDKELNTFTQLDAINASYTITLVSAINGIGRFYRLTFDLDNMTNNSI
jgi:hypothetical protein